MDEINLILTAPSFKNIFSAIAVISEIGVCMDVFPTAKHLYSWAGLTPTNNESAGKKKVSKGFQSGGLYQTPFGTVYCRCSQKRKASGNKESLRMNQKRRGHKRTIIAIARMLLTAIYHMLKKKNLIIQSYTKNQMLSL